jgi:hypothetical protein
MTNREISNFMGANVISSFRIRHIRTGKVWRSSYAGARTDHYDTTPMTPDDTRICIEAFGGVQEWIADWVEVEVTPGIWAACGYVPRRHGGIIGNARPGYPFNNHSNVMPSGGWKPNGGHDCLYFINSTGGTTAATHLPQSRNRKCSDLANQRATIMNARGAMSRAAAYEALIRGGNTVAPPTVTAETVNYNVRVTSNTLNIRTEPTTNSNIAFTVQRGASFDIDRTQNGHDHTAPTGVTLWGRIANGTHRHRWIALRHTERTIMPPVTVQPPAGTISVQIRASHDSVYIDDVIARVRGMGYPNIYRTKNNGWYQARIPTTESQARALIAELEPKGFQGAFIVRS